MSVQLDRRTFLRGIGTAVSLPLLEAMLPLNVLAQTASKARPNRMAFLFIPNGVNMDLWRPKTEGPLSLSPTLEPLKNVREYVNVMSGLTQQNAFAGPDGAGDHARSSASWLTGVRAKKTSGADIHLGISVDQVAARKVGNRTAFPSLELGSERGAFAGDCDSGYSCAYSNSISWRGESTPVAKEVDPRLVFERLFGNANSNETKEARTLRQKYNLSILDMVQEDAKSLQRSLGAHDQRKLDEYFSAVRDIELRLARAEKMSAEYGKNYAANGKPTGIPPHHGEHIRLMMDMMILAFQSDMTRIATFMLANDGSNRSFKNEINIGEGHHDISHHGKDPAKLEKKAQIDRFYVTQVAYLLERLKSIKEADGTMLDNSMIVFGAGISDGDRHNHDDLPILLAGRGAGTIKTGRHIAYPNRTPMTNLFVSMLDRIGVPGETVGDATGKLTGLF